MAAVAIARRLPNVGVTHLDSGDGGDSIEDSLGAARPSIRAFHHVLRIDEPEVVLRTGGAYRLGTMLEGWSNADCFRGHGHYGDPVAGVPIHQLWLRARALRRPVGPYKVLSAAAALATSNRFALPSTNPTSPFAALDYGLQLHLPAYCGALQSLGRVAGVQVVAGRILATERSADGSSIEALRLDDGRRLAADLFVDASGRAAVIRGQLPSSWIDWSAALPIDRLLVAGETADQSPPPNDRLIACPVGWRYEARTRGGTMHLFGYNSAHLGDVDSRQLLQSDTGCQTDDPPIVLNQGCLSDPWSGNCVAIGAAAMTLEPSGSTGLHAICRHIDRLIALWPGRDCKPAPVEIAAFNRRAAREAQRMRDFVQLPYLLTPRSDGFWQAARNATPSPELERDLALFREQGRLAIHDEDPFERDEWLATLIGLGVLPKRTGALAEAIAPARVDEHLSEAVMRLTHAVQLAPTHDHWLQRLAGTAQ
jgi:tryptophan halogenase